MLESLLPHNSTKLEYILEAVIANPEILALAAGRMTSAKFESPPPSYLPFLIEEYGLGELTPFVPNLYELIREGIEWQRVRGTPLAIQLGLAWLNYEASLEEARPVRRFWNSFQLRFTELPRFDDPDLERIEGIAELSVARRSKFRRGVYRYDVGALTADASMLDGAMPDFESGIKATNGTIVFPEGAIWSFGRTHEKSHVLTEAEGTAIGNWLTPIEGEVLPWTGLSISWINYVAPWAANAQDQRSSILAGWFVGRALYLKIVDVNGDPVGFRRCRAVRPVKAQFKGAYKLGQQFYEPASSGTAVYIEAMTQFGDASDKDTLAVSLLVGGTLSEGVPPGQLWLEPDEIIGGEEIAIQSIEIPLRKTVRDQFKYLLRF